MSGLNLENLSPKQKEILEEIWKVCKYFESARLWKVDDSVLAQQARNVGSMMDDFDKEEGRKNKSAVPVQA